MSDAINLIKLRPQLRTTYDAKRVLRTLEHLQDCLFKNTTTFQEAFTKDLPFPLNEIIKDLCDQHEIKMDDQAMMQTFLTELITTIKNLPTVELTLSTAPSGRLIDKLNSWITYNAPKPLLLAITINPTIIAGIKIGMGGKYYDYSLQSKFKAINTEEILGANK